ncbi:hypothetical protein EV586_11119 [Tumebacillus sp. BK434]|uniref:YxlC family protein n=1 Tax=Tumebacillus sp. BK434 TaxID=2512169 RepID=UPI001051C07A|nr:YxlC family protein [Tumebacillus sp. BK434]TCP52343.1 hypothetical protein EV586_11119 [Tumebacillus sp. BK434]
MTAHDEQSTLDEMKKGLDQLDRLHPVYTPDLQWFQARIAAEQKKLRRRLLQDLLLFWLVAAVVLTVTLAVYTQNRSLYLILQALAVFVPVVWLLRTNARKQVDTK